MPIYYRLTEEAYNIIQPEGFPKREALRRFAESHKKTFTNLEFSKLLRRQPVRQEFAEFLVEYMTNHAQQYRALVRPVTLESVFETPQQHQVPKAYPPVNKKNEPWVSKTATTMCRQIVAAAGRIIFDLNGVNDLQDSNNAFLNPDTDYPLFERVMHIDVGYALTKNGERLTLDEAEQKSRAYIGEPVGTLADYAKRLSNIDPGFIRFVFSRNGMRIGITAVFGITDAAYEATVRGERIMYSYRDDEIVSRSNNFVLFAMCEFHDLVYEKPMRPIGVRLKRNYMIGSLLSHIARLIDTDTHKDPKYCPPLRGISYIIHPTNSIRLKSGGFEPCGSGIGPGGFKHGIVYCDPTQDGGFSVKRITSDFLWFVRRQQDAAAAAKLMNH